MNLKPLGKRILVKFRQEQEKKGVLIVKSVIQDPIYADIVEIGGDVTKVKIGQVAYLFPYCGQELPGGLRIIQEDDIIGIVND